ncbi:tol-pal system YbgF family protein [Planctomycetota bacterium]
MGKKYRNDAGFNALKSKLMAAEFLARQMESQLKMATNKNMQSIAKEFFNNEKAGIKNRTVSVAPAKSFYETSIKLFSRPIRIDRLDDDEKSFITQYYNMRLRALTSSITKAGQALVVTEPSFRGTHGYVLVLPLLHASKASSVNINVLPRWMQQPEQLDIFSNSCLLHFGFPFHAMTIAKESNRIQKKTFSEFDFYRSAANQYGKAYPHIAVDCLHKAIEYLSNNDSNTIIDLKFEIVQLWLDSDNYSLAAGQAHKIFETYPNHPESVRAIWLYYYALSRDNNTDQILASIDKALADERCKAYNAKLMYIKWWSLRRKRDRDATVAALEYELLKKHGNDSMIAPILLSRSTDLLAQQNYTAAHQSLTELLKKFPNSKAAAQAEKMLTKLKKMKGIQ